VVATLWACTSATPIQSDLVLQGEFRTPAVGHVVRPPTMDGTAHFPSCSARSPGGVVTAPVSAIHNPVIPASAKTS